MFYEDNILITQIIFRWSRFLVELKFGNVDFCRGRKTGGPGEKPSWQGREPTNNSTHMKYHD
jgi:hypothetical protein